MQLQRYFAEHCVRHVVGWVVFSHHFFSTDGGGGASTSHLHHRSRSRNNSQIPIPALLPGAKP
jgi:hypothetical protein